MRVRTAEISSSCLKFASTRNSFLCNALLVKEVFGTQSAFTQLERGSPPNISDFKNNAILILNMKIKVAISHWLSLRIQEQTRIERRALRDYSRQELGRITRAEIRSRGLRLYAAWSRRGASKLTRPVVSEWPTPFEQAA
jgi:hypothetical protein